VPAVCGRDVTMARRPNPAKNEPVVTSKCTSGRPLLIDSAPQTEFVLTHSKQTTEKFLTGARTHIRIFSFSPLTTQNPTQLIQRLLVYLEEKHPKSSATVNLFLSRRFTRASLRFCTRPAPEVVASAAFLPGSAQNIESDVTYSKQSTGKFLPGATTRFRTLRFLSATTQNPARPLFFAVDSNERASHDTLPSRLRNRAARTNKKMLNESWPPKEVEALARELMSAYETGQMIAVPPSARPGFNLDTAYEVETLLKQFREAAGHKAVGRKVGYANKAMWRVLKLETLVWANMYDDTVHYADNNYATLAIANPRSLKIEPEIVFGLKQPLTGASSDAASALASVDWLALGFEIIDCPFPEWKFQPSDFVASFGLHAALVVGEKIPVQPANIVNLLDQLSAFKLRISKGGKLPESGDLERGSAKNSVTGGEFVEEGSGKNSLKSPALCLAELSAAISRRFPSYPLSAGEIISTGTLTAGHPTANGDIWIAEVEGPPLPPLTLRLI